MYNRRSFFQLTIQILPFVLLIYLPTVHGMAAEKEKNRPMGNGVFGQNIHTVQFFREGWEFSQPVIELSTDQRLVFKFDELAQGASSYHYTITHCNSEWYPSRLVQSEYMEGFVENPLTDFASSVNTTLNYTNYRLSLPNEQVRFLLSGNYLLSVFDDQNRSSPVITRRFYVLEPLTDVSGDVKKSTFEGFRGRDQEIDFTIDYSKIRVQDPRTEIKVVVMQNSRQDNCLQNLSPLFARDNLLSYDLSGENVFPGGNEFRNFDTKNLRINGWGVAKIDYINPYYYITLRTDQVRQSREYGSEGDINGRYLIKNDRMNDPDLESDYMKVLFSLAMPGEITGGDLFVFGALSDWQCQKSNKMKWNPAEKRYEAILLLKQGFYDYQYVFVGTGSQLIDGVRFEGSYVETENDYTIFVYYSGFSSRYDKLVGFHHLNSVKR